VLSDYRCHSCPDRSRDGEGTARKVQSHTEDKKDLHVVAFWVMTVLPVGIVAFMLLGAKEL
jgi:hypothetical protein